MEKIKYPVGTAEKWVGGINHKFQFEGHDAFTVEPEKPATAVVLVSGMAGRIC